jgi:hypothetical protein
VAPVLRDVCHFRRQLSILMPEKDFRHCCQWHPEPSLKACDGKLLHVAEGSRQWLAFTAPASSRFDGGSAMSAFFKLIAAGPLFFVSAWLLMIFAGITHSDLGIAPFGYLTSMIVTIGLWLTLAPAIGAASRSTPFPASKRGSGRP